MVEFGAETALEAESQARSLMQALGRGRESSQHAALYRQAASQTRVGSS